MTERDLAVGETFQALESRLLGLFREGVGQEMPEQLFLELALRVFRFQYRANPLYRAFVDRRGVDPEAVGDWTAIPSLPARAFKAAPLVSGSPEKVEAVFRTSGTTRGREARGEHHIRSLDLYRGSLTPNLRAHLLPEGEAVRVGARLPSPGAARFSPLCFLGGGAAPWWKGKGVGGAWRFGDGAGDENGLSDGAGKENGLSDGAGDEKGFGEVAGSFFVDPERGIRMDAFHEALKRAEEAGGPVLLAGTAFAFAQWLESARERGWKVLLPSGSRIMETGGYKGRVQALSREGLYQGLEEVFGVPPARIVNEYGMTELLSQFYEPVLAEGPPRIHRPPPWVRTVALHPLTLEPVPPGEAGILAHLDLANLGSVARVLTEDLGRMVPGGFVLEGRSPGAEPRGCSLAMEDFLMGMGEG